MSISRLQPQIRRKLNSGVSSLCWLVVAVPAVAPQPEYKNIVHRLAERLNRKLPLRQSDQVIPRKK